MKKVLLFILLLVMPSVSFAVGADSSRATLHIIAKAGDTVIVRNGAVIILQYGASILSDTTVGVNRQVGDPTHLVEIHADSVIAKYVSGVLGALDSNDIKNGGISKTNLRNLVADSSKFESGGSGSNFLTSTISRAITWTAAQVFKTITLDPADSTYQAWPQEVVVDSAGKGTTTDVGAQSVTGRHGYVRRGTYSSRMTFSGNNQNWTFAPQCTISADSLLITGSNVTVRIGSGSTVSSDIAVKGTDAKLIFENGCSITGKTVLRGADVVLDGGGQGTVFAKMGNGIVTILLMNAPRMKVMNLKATATGVSGGAAAIFITNSPTADSAEVSSVWGVNTGSGGLVLLDEGNNTNVHDSVFDGVAACVQMDAGNRHRFVNNHVTCVGGTNAIYWSQDLGVLSFNIVDGTATNFINLVGGADSNSVIGNNGHKALTNAGSFNAIGTLGDVNVVR